MSNEMLAELALVTYRLLLITEEKITDESEALKILKVCQNNVKRINEVLENGKG